MRSVVVVGSRSVCSALKANEDCEAPLPWERGAAAKLRRLMRTAKRRFISKKRSISPPWRGAQMPVLRVFERGGFPKAARGKPSIATIKQEHPFNFQNAKL